MAVTGLKAWVNKLNAVDLPVLGAVVKNLNELTTDADTRVNDMSDVVLKDSNLTSQLLKVANSIHFNPGGGSINTVTRAIIQVGFEGVKSICISLLLVDQLLGMYPRQRLLQAMACAFHGAMQAKALFPGADKDASEQVFIAALLSHVGELAVWSKGEEQADQLDKLLSLGVSEQEACEQVLELQFKSLTRELVHQWRLSGLLEQSLANPSTSSPDIRAVRLGDALAQAARFGWDSHEAKDVLKQVAQHRRIDFEQAKVEAIKVADQASEMVGVFGVVGLSDFIPSSRGKLRILTGPAPDPKVELRILRELSSAVQSGTDVNSVFQMIVTGLHEGVGLARVVVLLNIRDRLVARYAMGPQAISWRETFQVSNQGVDFFTEALRYRSPQWYNDERLVKSQHLFTPAVEALIGCHPCFIAPIEVSGRITGLLYADANGMGLIDDQFSSFSHFLQQTQLSLTAIARKVKSS